MSKFIQLLFLLYSFQIFAGQMISGPVQYHTTHSSIELGLVVKNADSVVLSLIDSFKNKMIGKAYTSSFPTYKDETPVKFKFDSLQANYVYQIELSVDGKKARKLMTTVYTLEKPGNKDFSFMVGSCAYTPPRTLKWMHPGIEERVYPAMIEKPTDFMLWTGDYLYYFKKHFKSFEGMMRRHLFKRNQPKVDRFLQTRPNYAIWDDHDYGPNNANGDFENKKDALKAWEIFWGNPGYGLDSLPGCFFSFEYQDCEFFMLDNRFYSTEESDTGSMLGAGQLQWLQDGLKASDATFKFIVLGTQVFNDITKSECFCHYKQEREKLISFISDEKIEGVIWITGDRHHTSLFEVENIIDYPFYEFTSSAITTFRSKLKRTNEYINPIRVEGTLVQKQNFGIVKIEGPAANRKCILETYDNRGNLIWDYTIAANNLKFDQ